LTYSRLASTISRWEDALTAMTKAGQIQKTYKPPTAA
jgi:hypothetical protein